MASSDTPKKISFTNIGILLLVAIGLFLVDMVSRNLVQLLFVEPNGIGTKLADHIGGTSITSVAHMVYAFAVGLLGAFAFFFGVYIGFIGRDERAKTLLYFGRDVPVNWIRIGVFCISGGIVASIFQLAQPSTFAPIQAFVLGATWPSVVTRIMSGEGTPTISGETLAAAGAAKIPAPPGRSSRDAEVAIGP